MRKEESSILLSQPIKYVRWTVGCSKKWCYHYITTFSLRQNGFSVAALTESEVETEVSKTVGSGFKSLCPCQERTIIRIQKCLDNGSFLLYFRFLPSVRVFSPADGFFVIKLSWHSWVIVAFMGYRVICGLSWHY